MAPDSLVASLARGSSAGRGAVGSRTDPESKTRPAVCRHSAYFGLDQGEGETRLMTAESVAVRLRVGLAYWRGVWS